MAVQYHIDTIKDVINDTIEMDDYYSLLIALETINCTVDSSFNQLITNFHTLMKNSSTPLERQHLCAALRILHNYVPTHILSDAYDYRETFGPYMIADADPVRVERTRKAFVSDDNIGEILAAEEYNRFYANYGVFDQISKLAKDMGKDPKSFETHCLSQIMISDYPLNMEQCLTQLLQKQKQDEERKMSENEMIDRALSKALVVLNVGNLTDISQIKEQFFNMLAKAQKEEKSKIIAAFRIVLEYYGCDLDGEELMAIYNAERKNNGKMNESFSKWNDKIISEENHRNLLLQNLKLNPSAILIEYCENILDDNNTSFDSFMSKKVNIEDVAEAMGISEEESEALYFSECARSKTTYMQSRV